MPSQPIPSLSLPSSTVSLEFINPGDLSVAGSAQIVASGSSQICLRVTNDIPAGSVAIIPLSLVANVPVGQSPQAHSHQSSVFTSFDHK